MATIDELESETVRISERLRELTAKRDDGIADLRKALNDACAAGRITHDQCLAALSILDGLAK
jgi:hypothetical protein